MRGATAPNGSRPKHGTRPKARTRRFPSITRTTARPEGGGRAASRDAPAPYRQWPILVVLGGVVIGLVITTADVYRAGIVLIGVSLLVGAGLRWLVPSVGMLAVRSRFTDVITYGALGAAIALLALMAQPNPIVEIPFLAHVMRFTVR